MNVQTPQAQLTSISDLETIPIDQGSGYPNGRGTQILGGLAEINQIGRALEVSHRDILPVIDIYAGNQGRDLGAVSDAIGRVLGSRRRARCRQGAIVQSTGSSGSR